jgi:carbon-monoxide dehydrogenase small subunit
MHSRARRAYCELLPGAGRGSGRQRNHDHRRVARGSDLHPVQRAFLEQAALQCGFCTPGFIVAAKALLDQEAEPSEERVRLWLANNLCRCTGYDKIVRAVHQAAGER